MVAAFFGFDKAVFDPHIGTLDLATRKRITVQAGASKEQVAGAIMVAPVLRASADITRGWKAM